MALSLARRHLASASARAGASSLSRPSSRSPAMPKGGARSSACTLARRRPRPSGRGS
jgi:hypothetical protein